MGWTLFICHYAVDYSFDILIWHSRCIHELLSFGWCNVPFQFIFIINIILCCCFLLFNFNALNRIWIHRFNIYMSLCLHIFVWYIDTIFRPMMLAYDIPLLLSIHTNQLWAHCTWFCVHLIVICFILVLIERFTSFQVNTMDFTNVWFESHFITILLLSILSPLSFHSIFQWYVLR